MDKWRDQPLQATRTLAETSAKILVYRVAARSAATQLIDRR